MGRRWPGVPDVAEARTEGRRREGEGGGEEERRRGDDDDDDDGLGGGGDDDGLGGGDDVVVDLEEIGDDGDGNDATGLAVFPLTPPRAAGLLHSAPTRGLTERPARMLDFKMKRSRGARYD